MDLLTYLSRATYLKHSYVERPEHQPSESSDLEFHDFLEFLEFHSRLTARKLTTSRLTARKLTDLEIILFGSDSFLTKYDPNNVCVLSFMSFLSFLSFARGSLPGSSLLGSSLITILCSSFSGLN